MKKIELTDTIERVSSLPFQKVIDETIIVEPRTKLMHSLDEVGSDVWGILSKPRTVQEIIARITEDYEIDYQTARKDIVNFLEELFRKNLVKIVK